MAVSILTGPTQNQYTSVSGSPGVTLAHTLSAGSNRRICAIITGEEGSAATLDAVQFDSVSMSLVTGTNQSFGVVRTWIYDLKEASLSGSGSKNLTIDFTGTFDYLQVNIFTLQDCLQDTIVAAQVAAGGSSTSTGGESDTLTSVDGGFILSGMNIQDTDDTAITFSGGTLGTPTAHHGATGLTHASATHFDCRSVSVTTGATVTVTWDTVASNNLAGAAVCYSPAAAAGPVGVVVTALSDIQ